MSTSRLKVLITGVQGYIGSTLAREIHLNHKDNICVHGTDLVESVNQSQQYVEKYFKADVRNDWSLTMASLPEYDCVVHLAGLISVAESTNKPTEYTLTNVNGTINVLEWFNPRNFIFASTAGAFDPINPYAQTKILAESIIRQYAHEYTIFRFFNVAGSDGVNRQIGDSTHLVRIAAETAAGKWNSMDLYGTDYDTSDGTCIRDYIHVSDLVDSIVKAIYNPKNTKYECLGNGKGYTNREVINMMKKVSGQDFEVVERGRRTGDPAFLALRPNEVSSLVESKYTLEDMCRSAYLIAESE